MPYGQMGPWKQNSVNFESKSNHTSKPIWKYRLKYSSHFRGASVCYFAVYQRQVMNVLYLLPSVWSLNMYHMTEGSQVMVSTNRYVLVAFRRYIIYYMIYWTCNLWVLSRLTRYRRVVYIEILQTTISNAFSWIKCVVISFQSDRNLYPRVQLRICQHRFIWWLGTKQICKKYE